MIRIKPSRARSLCPRPRPPRVDWFFSLPGAESHRGSEAKRECTTTPSRRGHRSSRRTSTDARRRTGARAARAASFIGIERGTLGRELAARAGASGGAGGGVPPTSVSRRRRSTATRRSLDARDVRDRRGIGAHRARESRRGVASVSRRPRTSANPPPRPREDLSRGL